MSNIVLDDLEAEQQRVSDLAEKKGLPMAVICPHKIYEATKKKLCCVCNTFLNASEDNKK